MTNKNYIKGKNFESRFLAHLKEKGDSVKNGRFFGSKGITDIWWVSPQGIHNEAQLKYSSKKPYISPDELQKLREFAKEMNGIIPVYLVKKQAHQPVQMELIS